MQSKKSFTLIELIIVIAIIGILSTTVVVALGVVKERARTAIYKSDLEKIERVIMEERIAKDKNLMEITGSGCSRCICTALGVDSPECIANMTNFFTKLNLPLMKDPWGHVYTCDENEGERPANYCVKDSVTCYQHASIQIPFYREHLCP